MEFLGLFESRGPCALVYENIFWRKFAENLRKEPGKIWTSSENDHKMMIFHQNRSKKFLKAFRKNSFWTFFTFDEFLRLRMVSALSGRRKSNAEWIFCDPGRWKSDFPRDFLTFPGVFRKLSWGFLQLFLWELQSSESQESNKHNLDIRLPKQAKLHAFEEPNRKAQIPVWTRQLAAPNCLIPDLIKKWFWIDSPCLRLRL